VLEITLRTPARFPFSATREVADRLLARVRGGKLRARLDVLKRLPKSTRAKAKTQEIIWVLDEKGEAWSSKEWARHLDQLANDGAGTLILWIGGAYGTPPEIQAHAARKVSLGPGTFPSWLACLAIAEQVYRADTIIRGTPYHHG
jgi:23S rRNA (pseudouridine1915-N3)-methyltransferase